MIGAKSAVGWRHSSVQRPVAADKKWTFKYVSGTRLHWRVCCSVVTAQCPVCANLDIQIKLWNLILSIFLMADMLESRVASAWIVQVSGPLISVYSQVNWYRLMYFWFGLMNSQLGPWRMRLESHFKQITVFFILFQTSKTLIVFCENKILSFFPMPRETRSLK